MVIPRPSNQRGHANHGWLDSYHTFSFADYYDPDEMGFSVLRVINEDRVNPGAGFPTHSHRDMEIISYVLEGALEHKDSMGTGSIIYPGDVQRMSAGSGVNHSEFNASKNEPAHFLQIWIQPKTLGLSPGYEQKQFLESDKRGRLCLIASRDGRDGSVTIQQDCAVYATVIHQGESVTYQPQAHRKIYIHVARGQVYANDISLNAGDGARVIDEAKIDLSSDSIAEILLFDLP